MAREMGLTRIFNGKRYKFYGWGSTKENLRNRIRHSKEDGYSIRVVESMKGYSLYRRKGR